MLCGSEVKILLVLPEMLVLKAVPGISEELSELFWLVSGWSAVGNLRKKWPRCFQDLGRGKPTRKAAI